MARSPHRTRLAPGADAPRASFPARDALPPVDDTVLREDVRAEILDGMVYRTMGAEEPHARPHFAIPGVLARCLHPDYEGAVDLLTRADAKSEFAPDVSIFPKARDRHGRRQRDEIALEIIDTTRLKEITRKAAKLARRGVRRVFVLDVNDRSLREWDPKAREWTVLPADFVLVDKTLTTPVPLAAFLDELRAEDTVAQALLARGNPVITQAVRDAESAAETRGEARGEARGRSQGVVAGKVLSLLRILDQRALALNAAQRERVAHCTDEALLDRWFDAALTAPDADTLFRA